MATSLAPSPASHDDGASKKLGRPTRYTPELGARLCEAIANSTKSLRKICAEIGIGRTTFFRWLDTDAEFCTHYQQAKKIQGDLLADEILEIADDASDDTLKGPDGRIILNPGAIRRSKLRIDMRKWFAARLEPKKYAEKSEGPFEKWRGLTLDEFEERLREYNARHKNDRPI